MPDARQNESRQPTPKWALLFVLAWAGLIFATSCTVIGTYELLRTLDLCLWASSRTTFCGFLGNRLVRGRERMARHRVCDIDRRPRFAFQHMIHVGSIAQFCSAGTLSALFAASDEWHQTFVPNRDGTVSDVLIDCLGISVVTLYLVAQTREPVLVKAGHCDRPTRLMRRR